MLNNKNYIAEGSISNLFLITKQGEVLTPPIKDGALPGVTRRLLIEELIPKSILKEQSITIDDLSKAKEVFLTNSLMGVKEVSTIDSIFTSNSFERTHELRNSYLELIIARSNI